MGHECKGCGGHAAKSRNSLCVGCIRRQNLPVIPNTPWPKDNVKFNKRFKLGNNR